MSEREKILMGSCDITNVRRVRLMLEGKAELDVIDSWAEFEREARLDNHTIQITDLNLRDCFQSVVLDNIIEFISSKAVIIFVEKESDYRQFIGYANPLMEILPLNIVDDEDFLAIVHSLRVKLRYIKHLV